MKKEDIITKILDTLNDCKNNSNSLKGYAIYDSEFFWLGKSKGHKDPIVKVGDNSIVVKMRDERYEEYAMKCYFDILGGREERYNLIIKNLKLAKSEYLVEPEFFPEELMGINETQALSVLKYKWIEGVDLYTYIETYIHDIFELKLITFNFSQFAKWIATQPFAHGSLSCDNIIVNSNGDIKVVDYDNMYTPEMNGLKAKYIGDKNYINPELTIADFGKYIDTTPTLAILLSLLIISYYPYLYKKDSKDRHCLFLLDELIKLPSYLPNGLLAEQNRIIRKIFSLFMTSLSDKMLLIDPNDMDIVNNPFNENPNRITINFGKGHFSMIYVEPGEYYKGATSNLQEALMAEEKFISGSVPVTYDEEAEIDEHPITKEYVEGFWISETLIKQSVKGGVIYGENGYYQELDWEALNWPIMSVTFEEAIQFAKLLSKSFGLKFDIPTETEWEFAAKGGNLTNYFKYSGSNNPQEVAVYNQPKNYYFNGCPLKTKKPNELGIYDMSGLLFEWCKDDYGPNDLNSILPQELDLNETYKIHIRRGGCMISRSHECRITCRRREYDDDLYDEYNDFYEEYSDKISDNSTLYKYTGLRLVLRGVNPSVIHGIINPIDVNTEGKKVKEDNYHSKITEDGKIFVACDEFCHQLVINNGIVVLGRGCCQSKHNLFSVELPRTLRIISNQCFLGCENLESVIIRHGVYKIGEQAFWSCSNLKNIDLPESLKYIEYGAFSGCKSLKSIHIPDSVEELAFSCFSDCSSLEHIRLPNTIRIIPSDFLWRCTSLKCITIPDNVTEIVGNPFCESGIEHIECNSKHFVFDQGFLMSANRNNLISCLVKKERIVLPSSIEEIGENAFSSIAEVKNVILPEGLKYIHRGAFKNCHAITSIDIPESIKSIHPDAFYGCDNLKVMTIRCPFSSIGFSSFSGISLTEIHVKQDFEKYQEKFHEQTVKSLADTMKEDFETLPF